VQRDLRITCARGNARTQRLNETFSRICAPTVIHGDPVIQRPGPPRPAKAVCYVKDLGPGAIETVLRPAGGQQDGHIALVEDVGGPGEPENLPSSSAG